MRADVMDGGVACAKDYNVSGIIDRVYYLWWHGMQLIRIIVDDVSTLGPQNSCQLFFLPPYR